MEMAPRCYQHPGPGPQQGLGTVDTTESSAPPAHRTTRKARTNLGQYSSLERRYFRGQLTLEEEELFEDLIRDLRGLYKQAR